MDERMQALFMQARLARLASVRWDMTLRDAVTTLAQSGALAYVGDCFDYFHLMGDDAVLDDVEAYLEARGVPTHDAA